MAITTKIETITVTSTIHHAGSTIVERGTIRVRMPSNYNPAFVTADDIENDPALEIVGDEPEPMDTTEFAGWTFDECSTDEGAYYSTDENVRYCVATGITEANGYEIEEDVRWARVMHAEDFVATGHLYEGEDAIEDAMRKAMDLSEE